MTSPDDFDDSERAILIVRTAAVARQDTAGAAAHEPAIFFRVGHQRFGASARGILGAVRLDGMVPVPNGGRSVAGAFVRNGSAIPVFHLAALVGDRIGRLPETAHGLLLGETSEELALAVDSIDGFGELALDDLREPPDDVRSRWVVSATADGTLVLDLDALRGSSALWVDGRSNRTD